MPDGFGFNWPGHAVASAYGSLTDVPIGAGGTGLTAAAQAGVRRLAAAGGIKLAPPAGASTTVKSAADAKPSHTWLVIVIAVALAVLVGAVLAAVTIRRRRRGRGLGRPKAPRPPPPAVTGRASLLRDQDGRPVSVAEYRGRPLIVTFVDPLCRNLRPLEAKLLNDVVAGTPPSRRPAILAVSVDVYADARADLVQDEDKWELVPQWHWAVGRPAELAGVWRRYEIGVLVTTKRIAATAIKYITHTEAAYIIDASGHERALFLWPFYPQDVEHTLRQIT